jgi:DNA adenine methylase
MNNLTPLRYPGGKTKLYSYVRELIDSTLALEDRVYVEPYAGGCGLALKLLFQEDVDEIYINDFDRAIWAFWYSVLNDCKELVEKIEQTSITIQEWYKQKEVYKNKDTANILELGFATLFLNRTNRSGIIMANPIGGNDQNGDYLIDCRFNKKSIISKIKRIHELRDRIHLTNLDAIEFLDNINGQLNNAFIYLDPPYFEKGYQLYKNSYLEQDHVDLRQKVAELHNFWFITYDDCLFIEDLYSQYNSRKFSLNYSAGTKRKGSEIAIYSNDIIVIPEFAK